MTHRIISQQQQFCAALRNALIFTLQKLLQCIFHLGRGPFFVVLPARQTAKIITFIYGLEILFFFCDSASAGSLRTGTRVLSSSKNLSKYLLDVFPFFSLQIGRRSTEGIQDICLHFHSRSIKTHLFTSFWGHPALKSQIFFSGSLFSFQMNS